MSQLPQIVVTAEEAGEGFVNCIKLGAAVPPVAPFVIAGYMSGTYVFEVWGWHALFAILCGVLVTAAICACVWLLLLALPRPITIGLIALYIAGTYWYTAHEKMEMDHIWAAFVALIAGGVGIWIGSLIKDEVAGTWQQGDSRS